jgi:hypothetical protein
MNVLLPIGYFPPISYFAYLISNGITIEKKEHFVKQSLRSKCVILGANGRLNLLVPRTKTNVRQAIDKTVIHEETDWKKLHWRSLESAYRNSPYFEYYEDEFESFYSNPYTGHFQLGLESIKLICSILDIEFQPIFTDSYRSEFEGLDLRNAWNKQDYIRKSPVQSFSSYIQVFSDRHPFEPDLSILDLLFCVGPGSIDYLRSLQLSYSENEG